jgi:hypothetical protein
MVIHHKVFKIHPHVIMWVQVAYNKPMGLMEKRIASPFCQFVFHMNEFWNNYFCNLL